MRVLALIFFTVVVVLLLNRSCTVIADHPPTPPAVRPAPTAPPPMAAAVDPRVNPCPIREYGPNGLPAGHAPVKMDGPAYFWIVDPLTRTNEWIFVIDEGQTATLTKPGQIYLYPRGCTEAARADARALANRRKAANPRLNVVYGIPPGGL